MMQPCKIPCNNARTVTVTIVQGSAEIVEPEEGGVLHGYARVSTPEQSLDMQIEALQKAGVDSRRIHQEQVSGVSANRPKRDLVMMNLVEGDVLVVWKIDRLGRSLLELVTIFANLRERGVKLWSLTEGVDLYTSSGTFIANLQGLFAQFERDQTVERTKAGILARQQAGVKFGRAPALTAAQCAEATELRLSGKATIGQLADRFSTTESTIRNWTHGPGGIKPKMMWIEKEDGDWTWGPYVDTEE